MKQIITSVVCSFLGVFLYGGPSEPELQKDISFYQTNLVCGAASDIGCGTRAKPLLAAFMELPEVQEAWLNHAGTIIAVVWREGVQSKQEIANSVFGEWNQPFLTLDGKEMTVQLADFSDGRWYLGDDVDQLSLIEADRIASQLTSWLEGELELSQEKLEQLHHVFEDYIAREFMAIEDSNIINEPSYWKRWEKELTSIGQKYVGDDMPEVRLMSENARQDCGTRKSCCTKEDETRCCQKKQGTENE